MEHAVAFELQDISLSFRGQSPAGHGFSSSFGAPSPFREKFFGAPSPFGEKSFGAPSPLGEQAGLFEKLSLRIQAGETLGLIGPSGCGKSTLLKVLAGLISPSEGKVLAFGRPLHDWEKVDRLGLRRQIQMTFQKSGLFDSWSCRENLDFALRELLAISAEEREKRITQVLGDVGLLGAQHLMPSEMSGGMQKRLGIARAIAIHPKVVLYDEPTAGLDPITSRSIFQLIQQMKTKYDMTVILVTSDPMQANQLCDRFAFLYQGKIQEISSPELMKQSAHAAVKQFIWGLLDGPLSLERSIL